MLSKILSISGKPGLFLLVSQSKNMIVVESLIDGKRIPSYTNEKAVALSDIAIFTDGDDIPLREVLTKMVEKENKAQVALDVKKADTKTLQAYLAEVLPNFDRERVYPTDIKKLINWYNLLVSKGYTDFSKKEESK